jgi:predicted ATPase
VSIDHGFFLHGKLDELLTSTTLSTVNTYGPFVEALTEYCNHVMEAEEEFIVSVRKVLLMNMSPSELLVIQETVPNVSKMLGCTPEKYPRQQSRRIALRGADAEERFIHIVCKFVEIISSQGYPIVLLLDDVQWSNQSSLALIRAVAAIEKTNAGCRLFVICTCREDNRALFDSTSQSLQSGDYQVKHIALSALSLSAVHQLITDVLGDASTDAGKATRTEVLARNIFSPTQGNPFHILQILYEVQHEKLLRTCQDQVKWDPIENESVISLIQKRLNRLPDKAKVVVKVAACLGSAFSEESLKAGVLFSLSDAMSAIRCCQQEGILAIGKDPSKIRFTHDEFRRAAYMMIPTTERNAFHLDVGRRLWHLLPKERCDEHLLIIADQMSHAIRLIQDGDERHKVSRLFLRAGQKAAQTSSFALAAQYLRYGIGLLKSKHWEKQYKLSLSLYNKAAEIEYYCGNLARVDVLVDKILKSAKSFEDTLVARFTRIYCLGSRNDMARALDEGFQVLKRLGERLPRHFVSARLAWEKSQCYWRLRGKSHQEILDLPLLADTKKVTALRLMNILHSFALLSSDKCAPMIASRVVRMTLQHGLHEVCKFLHVKLCGVTETKEFTNHISVV